MKLTFPKITSELNEESLRQAWNHDREIKLTFSTGRSEGIAFIAGDLLRLVPALSQSPNRPISYDLSIDFNEIDQFAICAIDDERFDPIDSKGDVFIKGTVMGVNPFGGEIGIRAGAANIIIHRLKMPSEAARSAIAGKTVSFIIRGLRFWL